MSGRPSFAGRDIVSIRDFSRREIDHILDMAEVMEPLAKKGSDMLHGRIIATLFYEASTRTRLSFETAITRVRGLRSICPIPLVVETGSDLSRYSPDAEGSSRRSIEEGRSNGDAVSKGSLARAGRDLHDTSAERAICRSSRVRESQRIIPTGS